MASVEEHYKNMLARHYTWMRGDYESRVEEYRDLFGRIGISPEHGPGALDLGAGSGFQSIALTDLGFDVVSVDLSDRLIEELVSRAGSRKIHPVLGDVRDPTTYEAYAPFGVVVCMGDTLSHLSSYKEVSILFEDMRRVLQENGKLVLEFRDLITELEGVDRAIPVRLDRGQDHDDVPGIRGGTRERT